MEKLTTYYNTDKVTFGSRGFQEVDSNHLLNPETETFLPTRSDSRSAGYDFFSKNEVVIPPGAKYLFWTDVKAYMLPDEVLSIHIRSSIGIKKDLVLANTTGIIDSSYYNNISNDGNIGICLKNESNEPVNIKVDERIAQGIFSVYLLTDDDDPTNNERNGGIGSTGF